MGWKVMVPIHGLMVRNMRESIRQIRQKVMVPLHGLMGGNMRESIRQIREKVMVPIGHQIILQRMPEECINAGFISADGDINQTSGKVNQRNFGERSLNDKLGLICAERVKFHYEKGNIMWV